MSALLTDNDPNNVPDMIVGADNPVFKKETEQPEEEEKVLSYADLKPHERKQLRSMDDWYNQRFGISTHIDKLAYPIEVDEMHWMLFFPPTNVLPLDACWNKHVEIVPDRIELIDPLYAPAGHEGILTPESILNVIVPEPAEFYTARAQCYMRSDGATDYDSKSQCFPKDTMSLRARLIIGMYVEDVMGFPMDDGDSSTECADVRFKNDPEYLVHYGYYERTKSYRLQKNLIRSPSQLARRRRMKLIPRLSQAK